MKTKLITVLMILLFAGIFSACTEEEITPSTEVQTGTKQGAVLNDTGNF